MRKHCIFEHFLRFVKQIRPKLWVIVTLHGFDGDAPRGTFEDYVVRQLY